MDKPRTSVSAEALRAYVSGDTSEPVVLSAFRGVSFEERTALVARHRAELQRIDEGRLTILESMILPFSERSG